MLQFLDKAKIKAVLINEGITMHRVVFYLAFVVEGRKQMVVAFEHLKPRLHILVKIYRCRPSPHVIEFGKKTFVCSKLSSCASFFPVRFVGKMVAMVCCFAVVRTNVRQNFDTPWLLPKPSLSGVRRIQHSRPAVSRYTFQPTS